MVMRLAVSQSTLFIMTMTQERLLALGANKMFDMPMLSKRRDDTFFNRPSASATYRYSHAIVTTETIKLVHVVGSIACATLDFTGSWIQFNAATSAVEVITVVDFTAETQRRSVDESVTLLAGILAYLRSLDARIAAVTQSTIVVANKTGVSQFLCTQLATEALRMPTGLHGLNDTADYNVATLVAKRSVENSKILFAVFATLELVEDSVLERAKALRTPTRDETDNIYIAIKNFNTYTKHWMCHNCPFELTIFSWASKPSSHRVQDIVSKLMLAPDGTLKAFQVNFN